MPIIRPIQFSPKMQELVLAGKKTATRRVIYPQFKNLIELFQTLDPTAPGVYARTELTFKRPRTGFFQGCIKFPYGLAGDYLYFKDTQGLPLLVIETVEVEHLGNITGTGLTAEGILPGDGGFTAFEKLWNSLHNPEYCFARDPWVWVIGLKLTDIISTNGKETKIE